VLQAPPALKRALVKILHGASLLVLVLAAACQSEPEAPPRYSPTDSMGQPRGVDVLGDPRRRLSPEELERGRLDPGWRRVIQLPVDQEELPPSPELWEHISPEVLNRDPMHLPLGGDAAGPSVVRLQVLLDRALFSPGVIDGRWGKNTEKAIYWFQVREELPATGTLDPDTFQRLLEVAGPREVARTHRLTGEDVEGPFVVIPEDIYAQAELECMCYRSLSEKLGERFHTTVELLGALNPGVELDALAAGDELDVPNVRSPEEAPELGIQRLVVSDGGFHLHALDATGKVVFHAPITLGGEYSPSPTGDYRITAIAQDPDWHYQPDILVGVDDDDEDAIIPAGPNNAVGVVWMALNEPHYGIHGTSAPETIGYATSNGCVRLTNWDARFLSERVEAGIPVEFRDLEPAGD
jgi:lipoprotein-anchoring transpeptidase ErfK/SrfK